MSASTLPARIAMRSTPLCGAARTGPTASSGSAASPTPCATSAPTAASPSPRPTTCPVASPWPAPGSAARPPNATAPTASGATARASPPDLPKPWACRSGPPTAPSAAGPASSKSLKKPSRPWRRAIRAPCSSSSTKPSVKPGRSKASAATNTPCRPGPKPSPCARCPWAAWCSPPGWTCSATAGSLGLSGISIDSSDQTQAVYNWVRKNQHQLPCLRAVKGRGEEGVPVLGPASIQDINWNGQKWPQGVKLWNVGVDTAKDLLLGQLAIPTPGPGYVHFSQDLPREWFEQLTAEQRILAKLNGRDTYRWVKRRPRNEVLDCRNYALHSAMSIGLHHHSDRKWQQIEAAVQPVNADLFSAPLPARTPSPAIPVAPVPSPARTEEPQDRGYARRRASAPTFTRAW